jgi:pimeloyl-ACP methyl ester carboxylesterase
MRVRFIQIDGYRVRVLSSGRGSRDAVVLPGMSASYQTLAPQIRLLRRLGYTTHVIELPGTSCGPALRREHATFAQLAAQTSRVLDAIGVTRALILGHSLGGGIALHLALSRRDVVERLILIAPAGLGRSLLWTYKLFCVPIVGRALMRPIPKASERYARNVLVGSDRRDDAHFIASLLRMERPSLAKTLTMRAIVWANAPGRFRKVVYLFLPGGEQCTFTVRARLSELRDVPMLVLWGAQDHVICARDAAACAAAGLNAEVHIRSGAGHMLTLEAPAWTLAKIEAFVRRERLERAA